MKNYCLLLSVEGFQAWKDSVDNLLQRSHLEIRKPGMEEVKGLICSLPNQVIRIESTGRLLGWGGGEMENHSQSFIPQILTEHLLSARV